MLVLNIVKMDTNSGTWNGPKFMPLNEYDDEEDVDDVDEEDEKEERSHEAVTHCKIIFSSSSSSSPPSQYLVSLSIHPSQGAISVGQKKIRWQKKIKEKKDE